MQSLLNLIIGMITARYLGPSNYGLISYAASVTAFFIPLMRLGLTSTLVQEFVEAPEREGKVLGTSLVMCITSSVLSIVGVLSFCNIAHTGEKETIFVCFLHSLTLLFQASEMTHYWFQAKLLSKYPSLAGLGAYITISIYKIYVLASGKSIYWFAITHVIEAFVISVALIIIYIRISSQKLSFSFALAKKMLSRSKYYIISGISVMILQQTDKVMLKNITSDEVTGFYSAAVTCAGIFGFVYAAIIDSMRPQILKQKRISGSAYEESISALYSMIFYLSVAQCIVTCIAADIIVMVLYGTAYMPAANVLRVGVWFVTFAYFGSVASIWLLGEEKNKWVVLLDLSGATVNVLLNLTLIPCLGAVGAAIASLLTQFLKNFVLGFCFAPLRRNSILMLRGIDPRFALGQLRKLLGKGK